MPEEAIDEEISFNEEDQILEKEILKNVATCHEQG